MLLDWSLKRNTCLLKQDSSKQVNSKTCFYRSYIGTLHVGTGLPGKAVDRIHSFYRIPDRSLGKHERGSFAAGLDAPDIREGCMAFPFIRECHSSAFMASTLTPFPRRSLRMLSTLHPFFSGTADELNSSKALISLCSLSLPCGSSRISRSSLSSLVIAVLTCLAEGFRVDCVLCSVFFWVCAVLRKIPALRMTAPLPGPPASPASPASARTSLRPVS